MIIWDQSICHSAAVTARLCVFLCFFSLPFIPLPFPPHLLFLRVCGWRCGYSSRVAQLLFIICRILNPDLSLTTVPNYSVTHKNLIATPLYCLPACLPACLPDRSPHCPPAHPIQTRPHICLSPQLRHKNKPFQLASSVSSLCILGSPRLKCNSILHTRLIGWLVVFIILRILKAKQC